MASEQASGQNQDIARLLSSLECDMTVQASVLKQYAKMHDAVKALVQEKAKINHEKQEVERLQEELSNKNKELLSRENHQVSMKNEPKEELFDQVLSNRIIAEDCKRRREFSEIRKKLVETAYLDKMMGQINGQAFLNAAHSKHLATDEAVKNCSEWQKKIEDPSWHPYKMITEDGPSEVLNDEDETLKTQKACGKEIYESVTEALKEMDDYNRSGRSVVPELWNYKEGRKATVLECVEYLGKKVQEQSRKKRKNNPSSV